MINTRTKSRLRDDIIILSDRDLLATFERTGGTGGDAEVLLAEIHRRELEERLRRVPK